MTNYYSEEPDMMGMNWDEFTATLYMAAESVKSGDIDQATIMREWGDHNAETHEGFQIVLARDVVGRTRNEHLENALESFMRQGQME